MHRATLGAQERADSHHIEGRERIPWGDKGRALQAGEQHVKGPRQMAVWGTKKPIESAGRDEGSGRVRPCRILKTSQTTLDLT